MLTKLSKEKGCEIIGRWRKACVRHFYWAVTSTQEHLGELKLAKFQAFLSHVINKHRNLPNRLFNAICAHGEIAAPHVWMTKGTKNMLQCTCVMLFLKQTNQELFLLLALQVTTSIFVLSSEAYEKLCTELGKTSLIKAIKQACSVEQTSALEGYHSVVNQLAPKMFAFSYLGLLSRYKCINICYIVMVWLTYNSHS